MPTEVGGREVYGPKPPDPLKGEQREGETRRKNMEKENVRTSYTTNPYGVMVKRCCASCRHRDVWKDGQRVCRLTMKFVQQLYRCRQWQMQEAYEQLDTNRKEN